MTEIQVAAPEGTTHAKGVLVRVAEGMLLGAVAFAPWPYGSAIDSARFGLAAWLLLGCALWALGRARARQTMGGVALALVIPALGLAQIASGTSVAWVSTAEASLVWAAIGGALAVAAESARERRFAVRLGAVVLAVCAAQALFAVVQWSVAPGSIYGRTSPIVTSASGSFVSHNHFAGLVEMGALMALGWALGLVRRARGPTPGALGLAGLGAALMASHLASNSRGGFAALIAGLLALGALWWIIYARARSGRRLAAVILSLTLGATLAFGWLAVPASTRGHLVTTLRGSAEPSGAYRLDMAAATLRLWASRPWLGSGLGAYADAVTATKRGWGDTRATHAENDVLEFAAEAGLAGVIAVVLLVLALGARSARLLRERGDPVRRGLALGALAGVAALALHSLLDFNLRIPANALVCAMLAALAAAPSEGPSSRPRRVSVVGLAALFLFLALAASWRAVGARTLAAATETREPYARFVALSEVVRWHPYDASAWRWRARARLAAWAATDGPQARARHERAAQDLERALRLRPQWGETWGDLAWVFWRLGDAPRARDAFERATQVDPTHRSLGLAFVRFLEAEGDPEAAERERARIESFNPRWRAPSPPKERRATP